MTTVQIDTPPPARAGPPAGLVFLLVFGPALALYLATGSDHFFSDGVHLTAMVEGGPRPYYNLLYVPLGWALDRGLGASIGLDVAGSLRLLSALSVALSAGLLALALRRRGTGPWVAAAWLTAFVLAPSIRFFATTIEVHALQLLGLSCATLLALSAARLPRRAALLRVGAAVALALSVHLTSVLLVPALLLAAKGTGGEHGLSLKPGPILGLLAAAVVLAPLLLWLGGGVAMLQLCVDLFLGRFREGRLYSPVEMLEFTWSEAVLALGALWLALVFVPLGRSAPDRTEVRRLTLVTLFALVPFLLVFPQGGVREHGGYFLSLAPMLVLLGAEATRRSPRAAGFVGLLALAVGGLQLRARLQAPPRPNATLWAARVAQLVGTESYIYTTTLPRWHALAYEREARLASDIVRQMELTPRRLRAAQAGVELGKFGGQDVQLDDGVYLDRELFGADLETPADDLVAPFVEAVLATGVVDLEPVPASDPLLVRVVPRER